jgi:hypothetical protein
MLLVLLAPDVWGLCFYIRHVPIYLTIVECEGFTSSTVGIKSIASTFRYRVEDKSTVSNTVGPATQLYALY